MNVEYLPCQTNHLILFNLSNEVLSVDVVRMHSRRSRFMSLADVSVLLFVVRRGPHHLAIKWLARHVHADLAGQRAIYCRWRAVTVCSACAVVHIDIGSSHSRPRRLRCRHAFFELIAIVAHANKNYDKNNDGNPVRVTATATSIDGRGHDMSDSAAAVLSITSVEAQIEWQSAPLKFTWLAITACTGFGVTERSHRATLFLLSSFVTVAISKAVNHSRALAMKCVVRTRTSVEREIKTLFRIACLSIAAHPAFGVTERWCTFMHCRIASFSALT